MPELFRGGPSTLELSVSENKHFLASFFGGCAALPVTLQPLLALNKKTP